MAEESGTPCCSTSALRFADEYADIAPDAVQAISSWGPNGFETYSIHQLEPILMLIQSRPVRVMAHTAPILRRWTSPLRTAALRR